MIGQQEHSVFTDYCYDAFISYRHLPKDEKAAVRLQQLLEGHKKTDGRSLHIFRDQSELLTSSDLGADIRQALEQSRYLIVVCSPAYEESKWCMEEIDYFRRLHGESNRCILLLLVEGEPKESFPRQLKWELREGSTCDGTPTTVRMEVEPLSADIRADKERKMLQRLRTEYLRIAAPLLDCGFDDLYRRAQRQKRRRMRSITAAVVAAAIAFSCYSLYMFGRISQKQQELYANESMRLAALSEEQWKEEDYRLALLLAQAALPEQTKRPERPLLPEAVAALRSAVTQQMAAENYQPLQIQARMSFNVASWVICGSYDEGRKLAVSDYENTYLYDVATGMLLFSCQGHEIYFNEDATRAARINYELAEGNRYDAVVELYTTWDGHIYFSGQYPREDPVAGLWEEATDCCYFLYKDYKDYQGDPELVLLGVADADGNSLTGVSLTPELEERYEDGYLYSYFDSYYYYNPEKDSDYTLDGKVSDRAVGQEELLRELAEWLQSFGYGVHGAKITDDGEVLLFSVYSSGGFWSGSSSENTAGVLISLKGLAENRFWMQILPGYCYLDRSNGLIYQTTRSELYILTYREENFINEDITDTVQAVSVDEKLCLGITLDDVAGRKDRVRLRVWETDATKTPLLDTWIAADEGFQRYLYYATPNMDYVFLQTEEGELQLWAPRQGCLLAFSPDTSAGEITSLTVSADGTLLAFACKESNFDHWIEVRSATDGSLVRRYDFSEDLFALTHLEFEGEYLLAASENQSMILDLNGNQTPIEIPYGNIGYHRDYYLTADGLLFCTMRTNKLYELSAVYDTKTGEQVFGDAMYFQYNEKSDTLVYQISNNVSDLSTSVHVARRNQEGRFEDAYTLVPQNFNMILHSGQQCMDEKYFLLNGDEVCEVYETATGNKVLTLRGNAYLLVDGVLYDQRFNSTGTLLRYPIMDLSELQEKAQRYLTSEYGIRELTAQEKTRYFISQ